MPDYAEQYRMNQLRVESLIERFFQDTLIHDWPLTWHDSQLRPIFGVDVFSSEFPIAKGYKIFNGDHADILLIRLENLDTCCRAAFKEFLDLDDFTLVKTNVAKEKPYASVYDDFRRTIAFPDDYLTRMYSSKYAQHFYSAEELCNFRANWAEQLYEKP
ncbi:MAG TPA: putative capsular polysaccharide synthesis family protein [Acidimicrobiia bacterium]|nr:putative capsular polysaccharide synthesis family protein [Acidimicrobiia bacterium]